MGRREPFRILRLNILAIIHRLLDTKNRHEKAAAARAVNRYRLGFLLVMTQQLQQLQQHFLRQTLLSFLQCPMR